MRDKLEIKDKINSLYNPNEAWLSSLLTRVLRLVVFLLIGLFLAYIKSHEQASKGIMTICYEIFLSLNTLFSFSKGIVATLYLIKAKYQTILIVLGVAVGLEIFWYPFSNWVINQLVLLFNRTRNLFKRTKSIFDDGARCVLLDGPWGSAKTTYYKNHIKPHFNSESIYISCFSATREQLITQLIIANPIFNLLSLHGVLSGLIKNSWQSFMPRNKIIVFDDLERLHKADDETYRDLIGIMSLLKEQNNCKLLMICCRAEIKAEIFNKYLERICDFEIGDYGKSTKHVDLLNDKDLNRILNKISDKKIIDDCKYYLSRSIDKYYNLRVIRLTLISLIRSINELFKNQIIKGHQYKFDDFRHLIDRLLEYIFQDIKMAVKLNVVYFSQYEVYKVISDDEIFRSIVQRKTSQDKLNDAEKDILKNLQMLKLDPNEILKFKLPERNILENMLGRLNLKDFILNNYLKIKHIEFNKYELFFQLAYINKFFPLSELSMKTFDFNSGIKKQLLIAYGLKTQKSGDSGNLTYYNFDSIKRAVTSEGFNHSNNLNDEYNLIEVERSNITASKVLEEDTFKKIIGEFTGPIDFNGFALGCIFNKLNKNELVTIIINHMVSHYYQEDVQIFSEKEKKMNAFIHLSEYFLWFYNKSDSFQDALDDMYDNYKEFCCKYFVAAIEKYHSLAEPIIKLSILRLISSFINVQLDDDINFSENGGVSFEFIKEVEQISQQLNDISPSQKIELKKGWLFILEVYAKKIKQERLSVSDGMKPLFREYFHDIVQMVRCEGEELELLKRELDIS